MCHNDINDYETLIIQVQVNFNSEIYLRGSDMWHKINNKNSIRKSNKFSFIKNELKCDSYLDFIYNSLNDIIIIVIIVTYDITEYDFIDKWNVIW